MDTREKSRRIREAFRGFQTIHGRWPTTNEAREAVAQAGLAVTDDAILNARRALIDHGPSRDQTDQRQRLCLRCRELFRSTHRFNRICLRCAPINERVGS